MSKKFLQWQIWFVQDIVVEDNTRTYNVEDMKYFCQQGAEGILLGWYISCSIYTPVPLYRRPVESITLHAMTGRYGNMDKKIVLLM